ncbi:tyrosine-type recombinase/integrase [Nonomuraea rhizosphaerae]|uniref:tyrosine-type recombinase/integrase n=1 Tax=Nonomuraea rhizosphaerae TaxID=2665663 RepID=UPI001C5E316A|nr:tyrosine-type recombinase/integrase [Nonomuraea rhizosphaerae]
MSDNVIHLDTRTPRRRAPKSYASQAIAIPRGADLTLCLESWTLSLESAHKAVKTIRSYTDTAKSFIAYLRGNSLPCDAERVTAEHVRAFIVYERNRTSPASADTAFRNLRVWFNWLRAEGERTTGSPVLAGDRPKVPRKVRRYLSDGEQRQLLATAAGKDFEDRRDTALIRILGDSGPRRTGLMNVRYTPRDPATNDVDLKGRRLRIVLKGGDEHWLPLGAKAAAALDRYLRARSGHRKAAESPWLWLGVTGRGVGHMTDSGLYQMLERRAGTAGIAGKVTPHMFRGTAAHELLRAGASDGDVQQIMGWRTREMVAHYTGELAAERARETHARLSPGDRI